MSLDEVIIFEWNSGNLDKSRRKHGVTPEEAESVFTDENSLVLPDKKHSIIEKRFAIFGKSDLNRSLYVIFTVRGEKVRIISARRIWRPRITRATIRRARRTGFVIVASAITAIRSV